MSSPSEDSYTDVVEPEKSSRRKGSCNGLSSSIMLTRMNSTPPDHDHDQQQAKSEGEDRQRANEFSTKSETDDQPMKRLSLRISRELIRRRSSLTEQLPDTPRGWTTLISLLGSVIFGYEVALQRKLTAPPIVYGQVNSDAADSGSLLADIYSKLTATPETILVRPIRPSLLVGTRGLLSSVAAYLASGPAILASSPADLNGNSASRNFRQVLTMTQDGAKIAVDWELPEPNYLKHSTEPDRTAALASLQEQVKNGPIPYHTVVLILHGINNDASFGYIRSLMRACTNRGWLACGMNFRGCGKQPMATPRSYTGAYTGDIRNVVWQIAGKLPPNGKLFLVGNSLGANLVTKYLGEEGLSGTLPECVAGGISLGNPLTMRSDRLNPVISSIMALGAKKGIVENWFTFRKMNDPYFRQRIRKALLEPTLHQFDAAMAPIFPRNDPEYPFAYGVGYESAEAYWKDASSFIHSPHIPVPTMLLLAADDFLVFHSSRARLQFCLHNPNVLVVETKCGGHLGWQESPPDGSFGGVLGSSWSDVATTDFIAAVLDSTKAKDKIRGLGDDAPAQRLRSKL